MSKNTSGKTIKPAKNYILRFLRNCLLILSERITTDACIVKIFMLISLSLKCLMNKVISLQPAGLFTVITIMVVV